MAMVQNRLQSDCVSQRCCRSGSSGWVIQGCRDCARRFSWTVTETMAWSLNSRKAERQATRYPCEWWQLSVKIKFCMFYLISCNSQREYFYACKSLATITRVECTYRLDILKKVQQNIAQTNFAPILLYWVLKSTYLWKRLANIRVMFLTIPNIYRWYWLWGPAFCSLLSLMILDYDNMV